MKLRSRSEDNKTIPTIEHITFLKPIRIIPSQILKSTIVH